MKRVFCFILCAVLLFCVVADTCTYEADAVAIEIAAAAIGVGIYFLVASGITFSSMGDARKASEQFLRDNADSLSAVTAIAESVTGGVFSMTAATVPYLTQIFSDIGTYFGVNPNTVEYEIPSLVCYNDLIINEVEVGDYILYENAPYSFDSVVSATINGCTYTYSCFVSSNFYIKCDITHLDGTTSSTSILGMAMYNSNYTMFGRFGFYLGTNSDGGLIAVPYISGYHLKADGTVFFNPVGSSYPYSTKNISNLTPASSTLITMSFPLTSTELPSATEEVSTGRDTYGSGVINDAYSGALAENASIDALVGALIDALGLDDTAVLPITQSGVLTDSGVLDYVDTEAGTGEGEQTQTEILNYTDYVLPSLNNIFPFCIPFDLIALVGALNATAEAPIFRIPLDFSFVGYEGELVVDLTDYSQLTSVIRWGVTIFFVLGLILVTRKLIKG